MRSCFVFILFVASVHPAVASQAQEPLMEVSEEGEPMAVESGPGEPIEEIPTAPRLVDDEGPEPKGLGGTMVLASLAGVLGAAGGYALTWLLPVGSGLGCIDYEGDGSCGTPGSGMLAVGALNSLLAGAGIAGITVGIGRAGGWDGDFWPTFLGTLLGSILVAVGSAGLQEDFGPPMVLAGHVLAPIGAAIAFGLTAEPAGTREQDPERDVAVAF
ncbi:MAG: hypothetical protein KC416_03460 [Myxococcales bacterium]|nr:hypothetical protein [Myxococcales bacterium]